MSYLAKSRRPSNTALRLLLAYLVLTGALPAHAARAPQTKTKAPTPSAAARKSEPQVPRASDAKDRVTPSALQANGKIAFVSDRANGQLDIYLMNPDGSSQTPLTTDPSDDFQPEWSPDGSKIAFTSTRDGNNEIYLIEVAGLTETRLTNNADEDFSPVFSPDGSKIAFVSSRDGNDEIYLMNADGTGQTRLTNNFDHDGEPAFSPDGGKIVFEAGRDGDLEVYAMNVDGTAQANVSNSNAGDDGNPSYSPDGGKIAFVSSRDGDFEVYVMNANGTAQTRLTSQAGFDFNPAFSPDAGKIVFKSERDGNSEIYVMNANGTAQTRLTNDPTSEQEPAWQTLLSCTPPPPNGVSWYRAEDSPNDEFGTNNGTFRNGASTGSGFVGSAFILDGTDDFVQVSSPVGLPVGNAARTMELWFKTPVDLVASPDSALVQYGTPFVNNQMFGLITASSHPGKLYFFGYNNDLPGVTTLRSDTWYHGAVTYDGATLNLYLNGRLEATKNTSALNTMIDPDGLTIGYRPEINARWQGQLDEVQIYSRALTAAEVKNIYDAKNAGKCIPSATQNITASNTNDSGPGSLRQAILDANASPGAQTIDFNIPGAGVRTINLASPLPDITDPVIIDGYTQPGASVNTLATGDNAVLLIELNGAGAGAGADGLRLNANGSTVSGLVINRFNDIGIVLNGDNNVISGNFIGTDPTGLVDLGNGDTGIEMESPNADNNLIGGTTPATRNIISGNNNSGIEFEGASTGNTVQGNFIGLGSDGMTSLGNFGYGVLFDSATSGTLIGGDDLADGSQDGVVGARNYIAASNLQGVFVGSVTGSISVQGNYVGTDASGTRAHGNGLDGVGIHNSPGAIIGGATAGAGNLISANGDNGISISFTNGVVVKGNRVGTQADGVGQLGNASSGIYSFFDAANAQIGGAAAGDGNTIAFNAINGVSLHFSVTGYAINGNSIHSNGTAAAAVGIDLSSDGVTPNDAGDADTGANNLQNFPVLSSATSSGGNTSIAGTLNSTASTNFRVEFFSNAACDASGNGEGRTFLGIQNVTTDGAGNAAISATLPVAVAAGEAVTATATDPAGNTSEFSPCQTVGAPASTSVTWINPSGGAWNVAANWQDGNGVNRVPTAGDDAIINLAGTYTVTLASAVTVNTFNLGASSGVQTLDTGNFSLTIANASAVQASGVLIVGGTLTGGGNLNVLGTLEHRGTLSGAGTVAIVSGATLNINGSQPVLSRTVNNGGTTNYNVTNSFVFANGTFNNLPSGLFNVGVERLIFQSGGTNLFTNTGTVRKATGAGTATFTLPFNNNGTVDLLAGALDFNVSGTSGGQFNGAAGTTLGFNNQTLTAGSLISVPTLVVSGGTNSIAGTYNVTGTSTINGTVTITGNVVNVGNLLDINGRADFNSNNIFAPTIDIDGTLAGSANVTTTSSGTINFNGTMAGTGTTIIPAGATLNITGSQPQLQRTIDNSGTANYNIVNSMVVSNGTFNNLTGATFNVVAEKLMFQSGGAALFSNTGTVRKLAGAGATQFNVLFNNNGTVDLQSGTLNFGLGGTSGGVFSGAAGTTFILAGHTLQAASSVSAANVTFQGTSSVAGSYNVSNGTLVTGTTTFTGNVQSVGTNLVIDGQANFNSNDITADTITANGTLSGSAGVSPTGTGAFNFNGTLSGTGVTNIPAGATLNIGGSQPTLSRTVNNSGTANYNVSNSMVFSNGTFNNLTGATFNVQVERLIFASGGTNLFSNTGTVRKLAGAGVANIDLPFNNNGTVDLQSGTLNFGLGGTSTSGAFNGTANTAFHFTALTLQAAASVTAPAVVFNGLSSVAGTYNVSGGTTVNGTATFSGNVQSVGGTLDINGTANFNSNNITASTVTVNGTLSGSANVTTTTPGTFNFNGTMSGTGATNIPAGATLNIGGSQPVLSRTVNNSGAAVYNSSNSFVFSGGTFNNLAGGSFDARADKLIFASGGTNLFSNAGTLQKTQGAGTTDFNLNVSNTGTVEARSGTLGFNAVYNQSAGTTSLNGGNLSTPTLLNIQGGTLSGTGTITGNVQNAGTLSPGLSPGVLNIAGNYTQLAAGTLAVEIGGTSAGTQYDQLNVSGTATLGGTLNTTLINGFNPGFNDQFVVLTYGSRSGTFTTINSPSLTPAYNANNLTLTSNAAPPAILFVTNTNDSGPGSLRQAILDSNATAGTQAINFQINGGGVHSIVPATILPAFNDPVIIDGYTQPGASANTLAAGSNAVLLIELVGPGAGGSGLQLRGGDSTVRGLIINRFNNSAAININTGNNNRVEGCFLGTDANGTARFANDSREGVSINASTGNVIGGTTPAARNVISGHFLNGINIFGSGAGNNLVQGNLIGTDKTGAAALGNGQVGISISGFTGNIIGGTTAAARNVISGNGAGLQIFTGSNAVQGNYIGTDASGAIDLGNSGVGLFMQGGASNLIGGLTAVPGQAPGNIISGNGSSGIDINGNDAPGHTIQGNLVGVDANGTSALPNNIGGISIRNTGGGNLVGDVSAAGRNVVSGNIGNGISLNNDGNILRNNYVGVGADGVTALGNTQNGVIINSRNNTVVTGNRIAFNGQDGIAVDFFSSSGTNNSILANSVFSNTGLGIDLGNNGLTANDAGDADAGANNLQNFPVVSSAVFSNGAVNASGTLNSTANTTFTLEFFSNAACDNNGHGEGQTTVGATSVTTDAGGNAPFNLVLSGAAAGQFITATATDPAGNTSEFGACVQVSAAPGTFTVSGRILEGAGGLAGVTVTLSGTQSATTTTDANGNYSFAGLAAGGNYTVTPARPNYTFAPPSQSFNNLSADQSANFTATLNTHTISGRVTEGASGLGGVTMTLTGTQSAVTTTDANGNYSFANLPAGGNYTVTPARPNYSFAPASRAFNNLSANQTADFAATANAVNISGQVTENGVALPGVTITLSGTQNATTTTDANGNYAFNVAAGGSYTVTPSLTPYTFNPPSRSFANQTSNATANFSATRNTHSIGGQIRDNNNAPLAGVSVSLSGGQTATTTTDANGNYLFTNLPAGFNYIVTPQSASYSFAPPSAAFNNLSANGTANFTATPGVITISGRVADASNNPLPNVTVTLSGSQSATALTDAGGNYAFGVPAGGSYTVTPSRANYTFAPPAASFNNIASSQTANFTGTLQTFSIAGRIVDASNNGVAGASVTLSGGQAATTTTDPAGNYSFANLPAGANYTVTPSLAGYTFLPANATFNNLSANATANFIGTNSPPQPVSGRVLDSRNGGGIANVTLYVTEATTGANLTTTTTDANGNYALMLPAGADYTITTAKAGLTFQPAARTFTNLSGGRTSDFTASEGLTISGRVAGSAGNGIGNVQVTLSGSVSRTTQTLPNGSFLFNNLPANGSYVVQADSGLLTINPPQVVRPVLASDLTLSLVAAPRPVPVPTPPIEEEFGGTTRDTSKFTEGTLTQPPGSRDAQVSVVQEGGKLKITPRGGIEEASFNGYVTSRAVDFTDATASVEVNQTADNGAQTIFAVGRDERNFFRFIAQDVDAPSASAAAGKAGANARANGLRRLIFQARSAGVLNGLSPSVPFDPAQHRYWRFRHSSLESAMFFETSPDRVIWTEQRRVALGGPIGSLAAELSAGTSGLVTSPGQAVFDNLSVRPSAFVNRANNVRFAQGVYRVNENAGFLTLRAVRAGDTSRETRLDYATEPHDGKPCNTQDGRARARCDFGTNAGTIRFAPGEREKTFDVFITDDIYAEGDETVRIALGFPSAGVVEEPASALVTIVDNDGGAAPQHPINTAPFLVRQQYLDFLNREPDENGFNAWVRVLTQCAYEGHFGPGKSGSDPACDRITVSSSFFRSSEFQIKGYFVYRFYKASLGRAPTYEEFLRDMTSVTGRTEAEVVARREAFARAWVERADFVALNEGITNAEFVDQLAATAGVTIAGRAQLVSDLNDGRKTRAEALRAVVDSPELFNREFNAAFVLMQYFGYLQRDPDETGYNNWLNLLNRTGDYRTMIFGFLYSQEYLLRFGQP